jgi:predicted alpha-1,2-mannosidase
MLSNMIQHIDPFIGIDGSGECLPGPYLPLGLVRLSPDTAAPHKTNGYRSGDPIKHFSHTHVAGTGGMSRYGNLGVVPFTGAPRLAVAPFEPIEEQAACGYYAVTTADSRIRCELTATARVGVHRYTFPAGPARLLFDVGAVIQPPFPGYAVDPNGWPPHSTGGFIEWVDATTLVGRGDYRGGWGHNAPYSVFFHAEFDRPAASRLLGQAGSWLSGPGGGAGANLAAVACFTEGGEINLRVGVSYVSVAKARASLAREVGGFASGHAKSFDAVRSAAESAWASVLDRVRVEGGTPAQRTLFATLFTRLYCLPTDLGVDDEFPSWHSGVRHFSDFYCVWDSVRNANSFLSLIDPRLGADLLNCLLDVGEKTGWVPDAWIAGHSAFLQGGCSAAVLAGEAALKNTPGIDYPRALALLRRDAEQASPDPYYFGRHLPNYRDLGHVTAETPQCVSRHLEYTYQDWCLARLAEKAGDPSSAARFQLGAEKLWNLWRADARGFAPRAADGSWHEPFDPERCLGDSWNDPFFYEGSSRQWSWHTLHDFAGLVARLGGPAAYIAALDDFFLPPDREPWRGYGVPALQRRYHSKEMMLHVPYLYHYAGRPDRTADQVRHALATWFHPERDGLRDNEDMGCQSAFYLASSLGLYPVFGQDLYWLTTPVFTRAEITVGPNDERLVIEAPGAGPDHPYIASATLDGRPLDRAWLRHAEIARGALLRLELSSTPTAWGTTRVPPSPLSPDQTRDRDTAPRVP